MYDDRQIKMLARVGFASGFTKEYVRDTILTNPAHHSPNLDRIIDDVFRCNREEVKSDLLTVASLIDRSETPLS